MSLFHRQKVEPKQPEAKPAAAPAAVAAAKKAEPKQPQAKGQLHGRGDSTAYHVLLKPLITEKAAHLGASNQYVFMVAAQANKLEVAKAIRRVYNVNPVKVNMLNFSGKRIRYGRRFGQRRDWKKAIITLKPGEKIEVYEGV